MAEKQRTDFTIPWMDRRYTISLEENRYKIHTTKTPLAETNLNAWIFLGSTDDLDGAYRIMYDDLLNRISKTQKKALTDLHKMSTLTRLILDHHRNPLSAFRTQSD